MSAIAALSTGLANISFESAFLVVSGTITLSGNYGTSSSHGDTLDLSALGLPTSSVPSFVLINEKVAAGTSQSGWVYVFNAGTTQKNGVIQVFGDQAVAALQGLEEYTEAAAYASASPAIPATLNFLAFFPKL